MEITLKSCESAKLRITKGPIGANSANRSFRCRQQLRQGRRLSVRPADDDAELMRRIVSRLQRIGRVRAYFRGQRIVVADFPQRLPDGCPVDVAGEQRDEAAAVADGGFEIFHVNFGDAPAENPDPLLGVHFLEKLLISRRSPRCGIQIIM